VEDMSSSIEVKALTKSYGDLQAVDHINFSVEEKEIFALLGPNGAGKTTTIRMICGLLRPTSGTVLVAGFDVSKKPEEVKRRIGYVPDISNLFPELSARANLEFMGKLYGLSKSERKERIDNVLELFQLKDRQNDLIGHYSKGMHRRITIAAALIHEPNILILDEPTTGLDAQTSRLIREKLFELNKEGKSILLTTHQIEEADRLCQRVGIIDHGHLIALNTPGEIKKSTGGSRVLEMKIAGNPLSGNWIAILRETEEVDEAVMSGGKIRILSKNLSKAIPRVVDAVEKHDGRIEDITILQPSLEDAFISLTGKSIREELASPSEYIRRKRFEKRRL
jgi:ABC-2 type transport system ATP-binding protein